MKGIDPDKVTSQRKKAEAAVRAAGYEPIDTVYEADFEYPVEIKENKNKRIKRTNQ